MTAVARPPASRRWPLTRVSREAPARLLFGLFFVLSLVLPVAPLNKMVFVLLFAWMGCEMLFARPPVRLVLAPFVVVGIFAYGYTLSLFNEVDAALARQFALSTLVLLLIHFVRHHRIDMDRMALAGSLWLIAATAVFQFALEYPALPGAETLERFMTDYGFAHHGERDFGGGSATVSVHLGATPFLFVGFCLSTLRLLETRRWTWAALLALHALVIVLGASRGLAAVCAIFFLFAALQRVPLVARVLLVLIALPLAWLGADYLFTHTLLLSSDEVSNAGKLRHLQSYFDDLSLGSFMAGRGLADYYLSTNTMLPTAHTEITPLDMARYFGVPLALLLYTVILFPVARAEAYAGRNLYRVAAMALYIVLSATNPVMFNSYGLLVVLWYWARVLPEEPR